MDLSPHFQPYLNAEAEQAGFKTDMETCGGVHLIFQRDFVFPSNHVAPILGGTFASSLGLPPVLFS